MEIVKIYKTSIWVESDMLGCRHVMMQHETCEPFTYCTFGYNYAYTSNSGTLDAATKMALSLGATEPVEHRSRQLELPSDEQMKDHIRFLVEGMSVSVDVSTCEDDSWHRYFGTVTEAMDDPHDKNGLVLLVQDAKPNFDIQNG